MVNSWSLLQRQQQSFIYYVKKFIRKSQYTSNQNTFDDIKKIVHFGILIHVLFWRQQIHQCLLSLLRLFDKLFDVIIDVVERLG